MSNLIFDYRLVLLCPTTSRWEHRLIAGSLGYNFKSVMLESYKKCSGMVH